MSGIHFPITGDNSSFLRSLQGCEKGVSETAKRIEESGLGIEDMFGRLTRAAAAFGVGFTATEFVRQVAMIRGEFQQLEVAFTTMLGSEEKATALMSEVAKTAAVTPFGLQDVAGGAKQLLAYGVAAEDTIDTLVRLGDIAAGLSIPLNDLVYLYGTTMTQGRMFTQDLRQFQGRGIPLADELAKQFGVAKDRVGELVTAGKVGFEEMRQAIISMTSEGGKFGGLMEAQSKTIIGQLSNIEDAIDGMFNEIGKSSEGVINDVLGAVSLLVENYEKVGEAVGVAVASYGTYKAALMVGIAVQKAEAVATRLGAIQKASAASAGEVLSASQKKATASSILFANAQRTVAASLRAVAAATIANPYVLAAAAITTLVYGIYKVSTATSEMERAQNRANEAILNVENSVTSEINKLNLLNRKLEEAEQGSKEYQDIKNTIVKDYGKYFDGLDKEIEKVGNLSTSYQKLVANMRLTIGQRQFESFFNAEQSNVDKQVTEKIDQAYNALVDKYGATEGLNLYNQFYDSIMRGASLSTEAITKLKKATFIDVTWGEDAQDGFVDFTNNVDNLRTEINMVKKASEDAIKTYQKKYNISDDSVLALLTGQKKEDAVTPKDETYKEAYKKAEEDWKAKIKALEDAKGKSLKEYENAKKDLEEAEKQFKSLGGDTSSNRKKLNQEVSFSKELLSLQRKNAQAEIDLKKDSTQKKIEQINLDYQLELDAIEAQRNRWKEAQSGKVTTEQDEALNIAIENAKKKKEADIKAVTDEDLKAQKDLIKKDKIAKQEYLIQFGTYLEQRKAITEQYQDRIAEVETKGEKQLLQGQLNQELQAIDEKFGYTTTLMADLFEDASDKSVGSIQKVIDKYEALVAFRNGTGEVSREDLISIGISESDLEALETGKIRIKDITDALKSLKGELAGKSPFQSFVSDLNKGIEKMRTANGDTKKIGEGISGIGSAVSSFAPALKQFSSNIGNIFGFDDSKVQGAIDAVDGLGQTALGVGQIMSGDVVGGAMAAVQGISQVVTAFEGMFGADYSGYEKMKAEYEELISVWDKIIARKQEYIDIDYGTESVKAAEEVLRLTEKSIEANRLLGKERLNAGASIGSHSIGVRQRNRMGDAEMAELRSAISQIGGDFDSIANGRMTGLFDLSVEQLKVLQEEAPTFWAKLDGDVQEYLEKIIASGDALEDTKDKMNEALTGISFDGFYDGFVSTLLDMESSSEDFAKNFEAQLRTAILSGLVADKYRDELEKLYGEFASAADTDGKINETEAATLRARYENIVDSAIAEREQLADVFGWDSSSASSSASSGKGIASMSQDTADELNGRFTALQIAGEETKNQVIAAVAALSNITLSSAERNSLLKSILEQHVISNNLLEDVVAYARTIVGFGSKLDNIVENTQNI